MALTAEYEANLYRILRIITGTLAHLLSFGFTVFVATVARPGSSLFSWHPFLMTLSFSFFMTEAVLVFSPDSSLLRSFSRKVRVCCHWIVQVLTLCCALTGLIIIIFNKYLNDKPHFVTWHAFIGLITVLYICMQCLGGTSLLYPKLLNWPLAKLKLYHVTSGMIGYLLGTTSLLLGMCSLWFTTSVVGISWYVAVVCPILVGLVIMNQISSAYLSRKRIQP